MCFGLPLRTRKATVDVKGEEIVGKFLLPSGFNEARALDRNNVPGEGQSHKIGIQSIDYGPSLLARSSMRLLEGDADASLGFIAPAKIRVSGAAISEISPAR
jgi:hypothetical protein